MTDIYEAALKVIALTEGTDISARCSRLCGRKTGEACGEAIPAGSGAVGSHLCDRPENPGISPEDGDAMIMMPHRGPADDLVITGVVVPPSDDASPDNLLKRVERYRFKECARICIFIREVCGLNLGRADYVWVNEELKACLQLHGNKQSYFYDLRYLQMRIEYLLSLDGLLQR